MTKNTLIADRELLLQLGGFDASLAAIEHRALFDAHPEGHADALLGAGIHWTESRPAIHAALPIARSRASVIALTGP